MAQTSAVCEAKVYSTVRLRLLNCMRVAITH